MIKDATHIIVASSTDKTPDSTPKNVTKMTEKNYWNCVKNKKFFIE